MELFSFVSFFFFFNSLSLVIISTLQGTAKEFWGSEVEEQVEAKSWVSHTLTMPPLPWALTHHPFNILVCSFSYKLSSFRELLGNMYT